MDAARFDNLIRSFTSSTRRGMLAGLVGGLLAALPGWSGGEAAAKKNNTRRKKKRRRRRKNKKQRQRRRSCTPNCTTRVCGEDGCGGSCGSCADPLVCQSGSCVCPGGTEACDGACVAVCPAGQTRNPLTCTCCKVNGSPNCVTEPDPPCCGNCLSGAGFTCGGRSAGVLCDFDAQCESGSCVENECTAP